MPYLKVLVGLVSLSLLAGCNSTRSTSVASKPSSSVSSSSKSVYSYDAEALAAYDAIFTFPGSASKRKKSPSSKKLKLTSTYAFAPATTKLKPRFAGKKPYFIEFRARNALSYGHTFVVFGARDKNGKVPTDRKGVLIPGLSEVAGLHPNSDNPAQFSLGHVVPVPALTGPSDGDTEEAYVLARYRINLTPKEFDYVVKKVRDRKAASKMWFAPVYACVQFTNALAKDLGLKTSPNFHLPKAFTNELKKRNSSSLPPMRKS